MESYEVLFEFNNWMRNPFAYAKNFPVGEILKEQCPNRDTPFIYAIYTSV